MAIKDFRFENLPRSTQIIIFIVLIGCLAVLFYWYFMKDLIAEREVLKNDIARLEISVSQMTAVESQLNRFKQELAQLEERLAVLRSILPAQKETPTVLRSVQHMAASSNLKILKFTPQPVVTREFYSDWPINIEVEGNYNGVGSFFEKVSRATRIIDVGTISMKSIEGSMDPQRTLTASCTATTFVFKEESLAAEGKNTPNKKENVR
jgi:type IV pilus assembly protein PilO